MNAQMQELIANLAQGHPIPWDNLSEADAEELDNELGRRAGQYIDWNDHTRALIFLHERKKYSERKYAGSGDGS